MNRWYRETLAYVHDVGHADYALQSAPGILQVLSQRGLSAGLIVDLGCGSGWSAHVFTQAGYRVLGVDISADLIAIAQRKVPQAEFRVESFYHAEIPTCQAVTAIGECLNYQFDAQQHPHSLHQLFHRVYQALAPGGVFIFDIAEPGQIPAETSIKHFSEGEDWLVLVEKTENPLTTTLTRRIITLRYLENAYRRDDETHVLRLYPAESLAVTLQQMGFQVSICRSYGDFQLPPSHAVLIAAKPNFL